jgi:hypothetical protein
MEIQWQRGQFLKFFAQMKIRVGGKETVDIYKGDEFEFDGTIVKHAGMEFAQPGLRGAVREDWATLDPKSISVAPARPSRSIAKAQSISTNLSRIQREQLSAQEPSSHDEDTVLNVSDRNQVGNKRYAGEARRGHLTAEHNRRYGGGLPIDSSESDTQEGVTVARLDNQSPAKTQTDMYSREGYSTDAIMNRNRQSIAQNKRTITQEGVTMVVEESRIDPTHVNVDSDEARVVGQVRQTVPMSEGGIQVKDTSGPSYRRAEMARKSKDNGSSKEMSPKLKVALDVYPGFPKDWNFFAKADDKIAKIKALGEDPKLLKALWASEGKKMKKVLKATWPDILG